MTPERRARLNEAAAQLIARHEWELDREAGRFDLGRLVVDQASGYTHVVVDEGWDHLPTRDLPWGTWRLTWSHLRVEFGVRGLRRPASYDIVLTQLREALEVGREAELARAHLRATVLTTVRALGLDPAPFRVPA